MHGLASVEVVRRFLIAVRRVELFSLCIEFIVTALPTVCICVQLFVTVWLIVLTVYSVNCYLTFNYVQRVVHCLNYTVNYAIHISDCSQCV